jgi:hypothetical protein
MKQEARKENHVRNGRLLNMEMIFFSKRLRLSSDYTALTEGRTRQAPRCNNLKSNIYAYILRDVVLMQYVIKK